MRAIIIGGDPHDPVLKQRKLIAAGLKSGPEVSTTVSDVVKPLEFQPRIVVRCAVINMPHITQDQYNAVVVKFVMTDDSGNFLEKPDPYFDLFTRPVYESPETVLEKVTEILQRFGVSESLDPQAAFKKIIEIFREDAVGLLNSLSFRCVPFEDEEFKAAITEARDSWPQKETVKP